MSTIKMIKSIKEIHPKDLALFEEGAFYKSYGKDAYIISGIFGYNIKNNGKITV